MCTEPDLFCTREEALMRRQMPASLLLVGVSLILWWLALLSLPSWMNLGWSAWSLSRPGWGLQGSWPFPPSTSLLLSLPLEQPLLKSFTWICIHCFPEP
jgi:hypothetical protein